MDKAWESTIHASSSVVPLQVWSIFLGPACSMSRRVLSPQSFSSEAHKSRKYKTAFILLLLLVHSHHPARHLFCLYFVSLNEELLRAGTSSYYMHVKCQNTNTVPVRVSQRNYQGAQDQSQKESDSPDQIHLEGRVAFIHTFIGFILLQNFGDPRRD